MGFFEMADLAGNDVSWRQRKERGLTDGVEPIAEASKERYCSLPDVLCSAGRFGQKTGGGWYNYLPSAPRAAVESPETLEMLQKYRAARVSEWEVKLLLICVRWIV